MISALERFEQDGARQNVPADLQMIGNNDQLLMAALSCNARQEVSHAGETVDGVHLIQAHQRKDLADTNELPQHKSRC